MKFLCLQVMEFFVNERYSTSPGDDVMFLRSLLLSWLQTQVHAWLFLSTVAIAKSVLLMTLGDGMACWCARTHAHAHTRTQHTHTHTHTHTCARRIEQLMKVMGHVSLYTSEYFLYIGFCTTCT